MCGAGYFVRPRGGRVPSFCVPLNTSGYHNTNILDHVFEPGELDRLFDVKVFYDPTKFPVQMPRDIVLNGDTVFLRTVDGMYLQPDFSLSWNRASAQRLLLLVLNIDFDNFDVRVHYGSMLTILRQGRLETLDVDVVGPGIPLLRWRPYEKDNMVVQVGDGEGDFRYGTPFSIKIVEDATRGEDTIGSFLNHNGTHPVLAPEPQQGWVMEYDATNTLNTERRLGWKEKAATQNGVLRDTMSRFIATNFPIQLWDKTPSGSIPTIRTIMWCLLSVSTLMMAMTVLWHSIRRVKRRSK